MKRQITLVSDMISTQRASPIDIVKACGGYYDCPKDAAGKRQGPLVGYAGKYDGTHQYVGDVYINFAAAESIGPALQHIAGKLHIALRRVILPEMDGFCGPQKEVRLWPQYSPFFLVNVTSSPKRG